MPFFVSDLRPQGFLGRLEPGKHRDLELPADILTWTDENVLKYIARRSDNAAGDLILGNDSYARYLASLAAQEAAVLTEQERMQRYPQMADDAMQGDAPGSSAGGEQPKFTAAVRRAHTPRRVEPVIVKFSPRTGTASGRRWGLAGLRTPGFANAVTQRHRRCDFLDFGIRGPGVSGSGASRSRGPDGPAPDGDLLCPRWRSRHDGPELDRRRPGARPPRRAAAGRGHHCRTARPVRCTDRQHRQAPRQYCRALDA